VLKVGLTGGIGAGKSVVAGRLERLGAVVIDADRVAREVVEPGTDGLREIVAAFGSEVLHADGSLDRAALGRVVFGDAAARRRLEEIVHPRVRARTAELTAAAPDDAIVVNDVPLLVEVGLAPTYHLVIVVAAARETRIERLVRGRGMTVAEAEQRIQAQASDDERRAAADVVLDNNGDLAGIRATVDDLWRNRLLPYERNLRERSPVRAAARVVLAEPDPTWPAQFARIAARIRHAVGLPDARIDHIGSTAVPGLPAEDVIDIQLGVDSLDQADALADRLAAAGFPRCPSPSPGGDGEERWHAGADPGRPVSLHVRVTGSPSWRFALLMRDHLRADGQQRAGYQAMKRALAAETPDRDAYAAGLQQWLEDERVRAEQWAVASGWQP
jgi:dephospho-CoA kinase